jgi:hypothetical protein
MRSNKMKATDKIRLLTGTDLKLKVVSLLIAFVCCLLFLILLIQLREFLLLTKDLEASRTELAHVKSVVAAQTKEQEKLLEANKNLSELESFFHLEMREGTPLVLLGQLSEAMGVQVIGLTPEEMREHSRIIEIPLVLVVRGDYLDILALCQELEDDALYNFTLIRYIKITAYSNPGISTRKRTIELSKNTAEVSKKNTEQASQASHMVDAELEISIFTSATPQGRSCFEWDKGSQPSIFYQPTPELPTAPELPTTPEFSTTFEPPTTSEPSTTPETSTTEGEPQP